VTPEELAARWRSHWEHAPREVPNPDRCLKCGAAPEEDCLNVLDGGLCSRRPA